MNIQNTKKFLKEHLISDRSYFVVSKDTVLLIGGLFALIQAIKATPSVIGLFDNIVGEPPILSVLIAVGTLFLGAFGLVMILSSFSFFSDEDTPI